MKFHLLEQTMHPSLMCFVHAQAYLVALFIILNVMAVGHEAKRCIQHRHTTVIHLYLCVCLGVKIFH